MALYTKNNSNSGQQLETSQDEINSFVGGQAGFDKEYTKVPDTQPTAGQVYSGLVPEINQEEQAANDARSALLKEQIAPIDEATIRQNSINRFQGEIDALNKIYAEKKREEALRGEGRLGSSAAVQARRGLLGSDFGASQTAEKVGENVQKQNAIDIERGQQISNIYSQARQEANAEIAAKTLARQSGSKDYIEFLKGSSERKETRVNNTVANIIAKETEVAEDEYKQIAKQLGVSVETLKTKAKEAKLKKAEEAAKNNKLTGYAPGTTIYDEKGNLVATVPDKPSDGKPITQEVGGTLLQYNPSTNTWSSIYTAPKTTDQKIVKIGGVDYVANADGSYSLPNVPSAPSAEKVTKADEVIGKIDALLNNANLSKAIGPVSANIPEFMRSGARNDVEAAIKTLIAGLALENLSLLKGPMSDKDVAFIKEASSGLNTNMSEQGFKDRLTEIKNKFIEIKNKATAEGGQPQVNTQADALEKAYSTSAITGDDGKPLDYATAVKQAGGEAQLQKILEANGVKISFNQSPSMDENGLTKLASSLVTQESGGSYTAVGDVPAGYTEADRALGKYQIVPKYHFQKIGLANTPADRQRFLNSPELQDQLFQRILSGLAQQYKNDPRKIAAAYYGGKAAADIVGTPAGDRPQYAGGKQYPSINQYVNSVTGRLS